MIVKKLLALALACVLVISLTACGEKKDVPELLHPIETANAVYVVTRTNLEMRQTTGGYVMPECVDMKFDFESTVHDVKVEMGSHVNKGDLLFELNSGLEDEIKRLELSIEREQTEYDYDLEQFNKQIKDMKKMISAMGSTYEGRMMRLQMQEIQLQFDWNHSGLAKKIDENRKDLEKKKQQLSDSSVYAPCSGTVVYCSIANDGDYIHEDTTYLTIAKDDSYVLACPYISETDMRSYSRVTAQIGGVEYDAKYRAYTEEELYHLEACGNAFDSYFTAELPETVSVGDYVLFSFWQSTAQPVITVPTTAVVKNGTTYEVTVIQDGRLVTREVSVGGSSLNDTEITEGLEEGEVVYIGKDLARYGVEYETRKAESVEIVEKVFCSGARRYAQKSEPYLNKVPGTIEEFLTDTTYNILVKKGDPIFVVKASINRSAQEQAKQDLRKYEADFALDKEKREEQIEELEKKMKKMSKKDLEYSLAELDLKDMKTALAEAIETYEEKREELEERVRNYEEWDGKSVTVCAESDGVISSISRFKVGDNLNEGDYLFDVYDIDSYCISLDPNDSYTLRYGQKVTLETTTDGETLEFGATIISAPNVRPLDISNTEHNKIYLALDNPDDYSKVGETGIIGFTEYNLSNCMLIDDVLIGHDEKEEDEDSKKTNTQQQQNPGYGFGFGYEQQPTTTTKDLESNIFDSEEHEKQKGKAYVWVYDAEGRAVKRYVRIMRHSDDKYWIVDGLKYGDTIVLH